MSRLKTILISMAATLALILLFAAGMRFIGGRDAPAPAAATDASGLRQEPARGADAAAEAGTGTEADDAPAADEVGEADSLTLKGSDFTLSVTPNGNERYKDVSVVMDQGGPVKDWVGGDGKAEPLEHLIFNHLDEFELKKLLPGVEREQIVIHGQSWIPRGVGGLETYSIVKVEPTRLVEVLDLVTGRDAPGDEDPYPEQHLKATVTEKRVDGGLAIEYRYSAEGKPERTLVFTWNGSAFVEPTGTYAKIEKQYRP